MMNQLHSKEILWIGGLRSYEPYCGSAINEPFYVNELIDPARTRLKENSYDPTLFYYSEF